MNIPERKFQIPITEKMRHYTYNMFFECGKVRLEYCFHNFASIYNEYIRFSTIKVENLKF